MRKKKKENRILKVIKEFFTYDRVYYDGKLTSLLIVILSFLGIIFIIIACMLGGN